MKALPWLSAGGAVLFGVVCWLLFDDPKGTAPALVANLGWAAMVTVLVGLVGAVRADAPRLGAVPGLFGALCGVGALAAISMAVGAERQNYWDAYHFAALFWSGALSVTAAVAALWRARKHSGLASLLLPATSMVLAAYVLLWSWMTFWIVQEIEGAIVRWTWHLTHG